MEINGGLKRSSRPWLLLLPTSTWTSNSPSSSTASLVEEDGLITHADNVNHSFRFEVEENKRLQSRRAIHRRLAFWKMELIAHADHVNHSSRACMLWGQNKADEQFSISIDSLSEDSTTDHAMQVAVDFVAEVARWAPPPATSNHFSLGKKETEVLRGVVHEKNPKSTWVGTSNCWSSSARRNQL